MSGWRAIAGTQAEPASATIAIFTASIVVLSGRFIQYCSCRSDVSQLGVS